MSLTPVNALVYSLWVAINSMPPDLEVVNNKELPLNTWRCCKNSCDIVGHETYPFFVNKEPVINRSYIVIHFLEISVISVEDMSHITNALHNTPNFCFVHQLWYWLYKIYRIMHDLPWIMFYGHEWGDQKIVTVTNLLCYFLHAISCFDCTIPLKQSSIIHFATVAKNGLFWLSILTSSQFICDVTRNSIVTSNSVIVLARATWHKGILTSE